MSNGKISKVDDWSLLYTLMEPYILRVRGKSEKIKKAVYAQLTPEQKRYFIFIVYYSHAKENAESFEFYTKHFIHSHYWTLLLQVAAYYDSNMHQLLMKIQTDFSQGVESDEVRKLYTNLKKKAKVMMKVMADEIQQTK